jgi:hypothetical protein
MVISMDETERRKILDEAYSTLDRLNAAPPSEPRDPVALDVLKEWRRNMPRPEPKPRERTLDTAPVDWSSVIDQRIARMKDFVMEVIGGALCESFNIERNAYADAVKERDRKIAHLEVELLRAQAELEKLKVRVIQGEVDRDRENGKVLDLPLVKRQEQLN